MLACTQGTRSGYRHPSTHQASIYSPKNQPLVISQKTLGDTAETFAPASGLLCSYLSWAYTDAESRWQIWSQREASQHFAILRWAGFLGLRNQKSGIYRQNPFSPNSKFLNNVFRGRRETFYPSWKQPWEQTARCSYLGAQIRRASSEMICIVAGGKKKKKKIYRSLTFEIDTISTWQETILIK